jgi:hypothetical protein
MAYKANSVSSTSNKAAGCARTIWRHNSEPIDPPAPVTITTLPVMFLANISGLGGTGSRPSKSSMSSSFRSDTCTRPCAKSSKPGKVRTCTCAARTRSNTSLRRARETDGMAKYTCVTRSFLAKATSISGSNILWPSNT